MASAAPVQNPINAPAGPRGARWRLPRHATAPAEGQLKTWMIEGLQGKATSERKLLEALSALLRSFYRPRMSGHAGDVEDLVQEALIAIHLHGRRYDPARPFTPWLFSIARHKLYSHYRRRARLPFASWPEHDVWSEGFEGSCNAKLDVERLLAVLPERQARAIRQTRLAGLTIAEAASQSSMGHSAVKVSVHRGMRALVLRIQQGGGPSGDKAMASAPACGPA